MVHTGRHHCQAGFFFRYDYKKITKSQSLEPRSKQPGGGQRLFSRGRVSKTKNSNDMLASKAYAPHGWPIFGSISFAVVLPYVSALGLTSRTAIILGGRALGLTNWSSNVGMAVGLSDWSRIYWCLRSDRE